MSAKNGPLVRGVTTETCTIGSKDDPEAGALTPGVPQGLALDPTQRRGLPPMYPEPDHECHGTKCLDHFIDSVCGCPSCHCCPCLLQDGRCEFCGAR